MIDQKISDIKNKLLVAFPDGVIELEDLKGDGNHFSLSIISKKFADISIIDQHKLVYAALGDLMKDKIHALSISTSAKLP